MADRTQWTPLAEWLLHNGGLLNEWPKDWRPQEHGPLIPWLRKKVEAAFFGAASQPDAAPVTPAAGKDGRLGEPQRKPPTMPRGY